MDTENDLVSTLKQYSSFIIFLVINIYVFYWLYQNFFKEQPANQNQQNMPNPINQSPQNLQQIQTKASYHKTKMTINVNGLLFKDEKSIDEAKFYQLLDLLSDHHEIFLICKVEENTDKNAILEKLKTIIEDNIVYKHRILFCTTIDGLCAMVRSIDPMVHIEHDDYVIINLIRYINEFWLVREDKDNERKLIYNKVKNDANNAKLNIDSLMEKVKMFSNIEELKTNKTKEKAK